MNNELKKAIDQLFNLCDPSGINVTENRVYTSEDREQLKKECIQFLSYLSASDTTISGGVGACHCEQMFTVTGITFSRDHEKEEQVPQLIKGAKACKKFSQDRYY